MRLKGKPFDVRKQCSFDVKPFLIWSSKATESVFVLDEVGCNLHPQEWFTVQSKIMRNFTQAQGFRKNVVYWVTPNISFIQKNLRFMCNIVVITGRRQGIVAVKKIIPDHSIGKNWIAWLGNIKFNLPSEKTVEEYENMKKEWNDSHLKEDIDFLEMINQIDVRRMNKSEMDKAFNKGIMKEDEYKKRLINLSYAEEDIQMLINMNKAKTNTINDPFIPQQHDDKNDKQVLNF